MIAPSQFENHHLQIQEAGLGVSQKKSRLREGNAARMRKAGMTEQGWSLKRPCTPEEKGSGTCNSSTVTVTTENQNPQDHAHCSWSCSWSCSSHTMTCAHVGSSIRMPDRPGWVFTPPVASILGNFRQISFSWYWVRVKKTDWKSLKSLPTQNLHGAHFPCNGLHIFPFHRSKHQAK